MGIIVDLKRCNGCKQFDEPKCVQNCPGDLPAIDANTGKAYIRDNSDCWDCMVCVKLCPMMALQTKLPYQLANYKATLIPKVYNDHIHWVCTDAEGRIEEFDIKTKEV